MADVPYWKRRRLAPRVLRVLERRAGDSPAVKAFEAKLVPLAENFINAYDDNAKYDVTWRREMKEGRGAVAALVKELRAWAPVAESAIENLKAAEYGDNPAVPDDVIADGEQLLDAVLDAKDAAGQPLGFAADLQAALEPVLKAAIKEWDEAEKADKHYQTGLAKVRETGDAFNAQLILFRRTFAAVFGRNDKDYQKLRAEKAGASDSDDDDAAPVAPKAPEPPATP